MPDMAFQGAGGRGLEALERTLSDAGDEEAERTLMGLYGVGRRWQTASASSASTARISSVDTHIRQVLDRHYPGGFPRERYRGGLGILQQYMFYYDLKQ